jgi:WD40 repeat protein
MACGNNIKIWDLDTFECLNTLEGHTGVVYCIERIDENTFASGSEDKTIKIWDTNKNVCLKTIIADSKYAINCLKSIKSNEIASGSFKDNKIWNIDTGTCIKTLNGTYRLYTRFNMATK